MVRTGIILPQELRRPLVAPEHTAASTISLEEYQRLHDLMSETSGIHIEQLRRMVHISPEARHLVIGQTGRTIECK
jgi:hypothetical protein